jgi:hypothetical protein
MARKNKKKMNEAWWTCEAYKRKYKGQSENVLSGGSNLIQIQIRARYDEIPRSTNTGGATLLDAWHTNTNHAITREHGSNTNLEMDF